MSKPICKSEARWAYWRMEGRHVVRNKRAGFAKWMKRQMNKARRRWLKAEEGQGE